MVGDVDGVGAWRSRDAVRVRLGLGVASCRRRVADVAAAVLTLRALVVFCCQARLEIHSELDNFTALCKVPARGCFPLPRRKYLQPARYRTVASLSFWYPCHRKARSG